MRWGDYLRVLNGNLLRQKLRASLTILSVVIGSVAVICVLAATLTVRNVVEQQLAATGQLTDIAVSSNNNNQGGGPQAASPGGGNANPLTQAVVAKITALPHVAAASPFLQSQELQNISLDGGDGKQYSLNGAEAVIPNPAGTQSVVAGRFIKDGETNTIVLSSEYLASFGLSSPQALVGRTVTMYGGPGSTLGTQPPTGQSGGNPGNQPAQVTATVVGVTDTSQSYGGNYISLTWGLTLATQYQCAPTRPGSGQPGQGQPGSGQPGQGQPGSGQPGQGQPGPGQPGQGQPEQGQPGPGQGPGGCQTQASDPLTNGYDGLTVKLDSTDNVAAVNAQIKALGFSTQTAQDILDQVTNVLTIVGLVLGGIGAISLLVAAIGIINTMVMATYERRREIGVMRATGASRRTVLAMFTLEAGMIGFWGGMIGLGIASLARLVGNHALNNALSSHNLAGTDVISFPLWLMVGVVAGTTVLGIVAGVLPAGRAARLDPVEALASGG